MTQVTIEISYVGKNFAAYVPKLTGCVATGKTAEEIKKNIIEAINFHVKGSLADGDPLPKEFVTGKYKLIFKFNAAALLNFYKGVFTNVAFERITGISQAQISHYATGIKKPRPLQIKKIQTALHQLGSELMAIEI